MVSYIKEFEKICEYCAAIYPIVIGHLLIPPLSYLRGTETIPNEIFLYIYEIIPDVFKDINFVISLLFDNDENKRQMHQWITHMFVHANYLHLLSNLSSAALLGYPVFCEYGIVGVYIVFFGGGMFAAIPTSLIEEQNKTFANNFQNLLSSYGEPYLPNTIQKYWDRFSRKVANVSSKAIAAVCTKSCGSSGAVSALAGCRLGLFVRDVCQIVHEIIYVSPSSTSTSSSSSSKNSKTMFRTTEDRSETLANIIKRTMSIPQLLNKTFEIIHSVSYFQSELSQIFYSLSPTTTSNNSTSGSTTNSGLERWVSLWESNRIGHSAHVQGMVFGLSFATMFGIIIPSFQRYISNNINKNNNNNK